LHQDEQILVRCNQGNLFVLLLVGAMTA